MLDLLAGVDPGLTSPAVTQIAAALSAAIESGELQAEDRLPPVRALASQLGVHFNTVARAYRQLEAAGLVTSVRGRGTQVLGGAPPPDLAELVAAFLQRAYDQGHSAQSVRWEMAAAIRAWMQAGAPPGR